jgi:DNA-binding protein H-NS
MTLDSKAAPKVTLSGICAHRRKTLGFAMTNPETSEMISEVRGGRTLDHNTLAKMNCGSVKMLFDGVHALRKAKNTADHKNSTQPYDPTNGAVVTGAGKSPADVNEANRKYWKNRS